MSDLYAIPTGCANCGDETSGEPRFLRLGEGRDVEVGLCAACFEEILEEPWVETVG